MTWSQYFFKLRQKFLTRLKPKLLLFPIFFGPVEAKTVAISEFFDPVEAKTVAISDFFGPVKAKTVAISAFFWPRKRLQPLWPADCNCTEKAPRDAIRTDQRLVTADRWGGPEPEIATKDPADESEIPKKTHYWVPRKNGPKKKKIIIIIPRGGGFTNAMSTLSWNQHVPNCDETFKKCNRSWT